MTLTLRPRKCLGFHSLLENFGGEHGKQVGIRFHDGAACHA
ncbi:MAG: hypothetical protein AAFU49_13695 [Pseudomonadota bacterium]